MFLVGCLLIGVGIDISLATPIAAGIGFAVFGFFGLLVYLIANA